MRQVSLRVEMFEGPEFAPWRPRAHHEAVVYQDRLWLIGGNFGGASYASDLWSTQDGVHWRCETESVLWPLRHGNAIAVFHNKIWIMGGTSTSRGETSRNDIWTLERTES